MSTPTPPPPDLAVLEAYVDDATRPDAEARVRARLPAVLGRIAGRSRLVRLARETWGYATDPAVPKRYKVLGLAALLYLINPFDAIPDFLPGAGYVDDAAALAGFLVAVRKVVHIVRDAANDVVTHAAEQAETTIADRGLVHLGLTLWTCTLAASVGLVYTGARAIVGGEDPVRLLDPFVLACLASALLGLVASADAARRVWHVQRRLPAGARDRLTRAIVSQATGPRLSALLLPIVLLVLVVGIRLVVTLR